MHEDDLTRRDQAFISTSSIGAWLLFFGHSPLFCVYACSRLLLPVLTTSNTMSRDDPQNPGPIEVHMQLSLPQRVPFLVKSRFGVQWRMSTRKNNTLGEPASSLPLNRESKVDEMFRITPIITCIPQLQTHDLKPLFTGGWTRSRTGYSEILHT